MDEKNGDSEWHSNGANFTNLSMGVVSDGNAIEVCKGDVANFTNSCSFSSMIDSIGPAFWDYPPNSQPLGLNVMNVNSSANTFGKPGSGGVTHNLSPFPVDSAFIDRAARFSSLSMGNMMDMVSPFAMIPQDRSEVFGEPQKNDVNPPSRSNDVRKGSPNKSEKINGGFHDDTKQTGSEEVRNSSSGGQEGPLTNNGAEHSSAKRPGSKKRRRGVQDTELEQSRQHSGEDDEDNGKRNSPAPPNNKSAGKNGKRGSESSDPPKEDYIHIRARRGQATNSHSLAERVRREKISERMKFLQDIVPGCNKVTGKAVMLDEIINYVQSLQRQVEFLSMKLATVDPGLDCNIESLVAKDQLFLSRLGAPSLGLSPDMPMVYPPLRLSQPSFIQPGLPGVGSSSDASRNTNSPMTSIAERYKELNPQMHNLWGDELHDVIQMGFSPNPSPDKQDTNGSSHMKVEF